MQSLLAERLLATVMGFTRADVVAVRPSLQSFAAWKYDEYEQFWPGQRFIESLARWLNQFEAHERQTALDFVRNRLFFHSRVEMQHLVSMAFADYIKPVIMKSVASQLNAPWYSVGKISSSPEYDLALRRSLFLGLSDGAHTDVFRRSNPHLSNEQIWLTYEVSADKIVSLRSELRRDLKALLNREPSEEESQFQHLVLLDDFSGSGKSYIRGDAGALDGKLAKLAVRLSSGEFANLVAPRVFTTIVLYVATEQARSHIQSNLAYLPVLENANVQVVQLLPPSFPLSDAIDTDWLTLVDSDRYYDAEAETRHTEVGGTARVKRGFGDCALPLVLSHNTPEQFDLSPVVFLAKRTWPLPPSDPALTL